MKINRLDKKLTIPFSKRLFSKSNGNPIFTQVSNTTKTKITINKNLLWKEEQNKNNYNNLLKLNDSKTEIKKKINEENNNTPDSIEKKTQISTIFNRNSSKCFSNEDKYLKGKNDKNDSNKKIVKNSSDASLKCLKPEPVNKKNFGFILHQVCKNLNKTFSNLYENNNRSFSSSNNNSLNTSIENNIQTNSKNISQRKDLSNFGLQLNLNNLKKNTNSLNSARSSSNLRTKLKNQLFGNLKERNSSQTNKEKENKLEGNNDASYDDIFNKKKVYSINSSSINYIDNNINDNNENIKFDNNKNENLISKNDLEQFYNLENQLKEILFKLTSYQPSYNECYDWINYYFNGFIYNKLILLFKDSNHRRNLTYIIKIELLCYCLCYHVSYDKNLSKVIILLKSIFEQIHFNFLVMIRFILYKTIMTYENYIWYEKLYNIVKKDLNINLTKKDLDEFNIIQIINRNINSIGGYFKLIIDNIYSLSYQPQSKLYKFPSSLYGKIEEKVRHSKEIISSFFYDAFSFSDNYTIEDIYKFFNLFLFKIPDSNNSYILSYKVKFQNDDNSPTNNNNINNNISNGNNIMNRKPLYYLPKINPIYKYTLILDLDETLIYLKRDQGKSKRKVMILRPFLHDFLSKMKQLYELILFSLSTPEYVDPIIDLIEKKEKYFEFRLYKQHAIINEDEYIKDLSKLGRDIKKTIIIDNNPKYYRLQKNNGICIKPFYGDVVSDRNTLKVLGSILERIRYDADENNDIRDSLKKEQQIINNKITSYLDN